jgi:Ca2+:H+ antiporter
MSSGGGGHHNHGGGGTGSGEASVHTGGGSTNNTDDVPVTYLTATAKIQRMGLKQRSNRHMKARRSLTVEQASTVAALMRKGTVESVGDRMAQSERIPLSEGGHLNYDSNRNNNSSNLLDASISEMPELMMMDSPLSTKDALIDIVFGKYVSLLLLATPVTCVANYQHWSPVWVFWLNFCVMIPLASILGDFTEELALHTNQTIGGLINATFGNAVEVVVAIQALCANEIRVVQASMLGSIFSNLLLVLGCCFFFGGLYYKEQTFNSVAATSNMGLLALSSIALVLPTPFAEYYNLEDEHVLEISRVSAIFLMFMYVQLLFFQLHTHAHIFEEGPAGEDEEEEEEEQATISLPVSIAGLCTATLLVAYFSEFLVGSIDGYCESSGVSRTFVGLIILPIVGNAVEHITAVTVAMKDKMDLSMGGTDI